MVRLKINSLVFLRMKLLVRLCLREMNLPALSHEYLKKLVGYLTNQNYFDAKGKGTVALAKAIIVQVFGLPEEYTVIVPDITEKVITAIGMKFNTEKIKIQDQTKKETVRFTKRSSLVTLFNCGSELV